jgi:hypothetical protein
MLGTAVEADEESGWSLRTVVSSLLRELDALIIVLVSK